MPVRNQNWYDLQEGRRYPLDDRGTGVDNDGTLLKDNIIVDCHIRFPDSYGEYAFVSGITVTENIVSVVVSVSPDMTDPAVAQAVGALSIVKPIVIGRNYPLQNLVPGVAGWIAFGSGVTENFVGRYSTPTQTLINRRNAKPYFNMPVKSIGKYGAAETLKNIVKIAAQAPVYATYKTVEVGGKTANAIVLSLQGNLQDLAYEPLEYFLGPCGKRPESGTCPKQAILSINGIKPDCNGNIDIAFDSGLTSYLYENCGGLGVDVNLGVSTLCPKTPVSPDCFTGERPVGDGVDECVSSSSSSSLSSQSGTSSSSSAPTGSSSSSLSSSSSSTVCLTLPHCKTFTAAPDLDDSVAVNAGVFYVENKNAPTDCTTTSALANRDVLRASLVTGFSVLTLKNCATDWALSHRITARAQLAGGQKRNAGVIVNYLTAAQTGNKPTFIAAVLDLDATAFRLLRYNGTNLVVEYSAAFNTHSFAFEPEAWYDISVTPVLFGGQVVVYCELTKLGNAEPDISFSVAVENYGFIAGAAGIFANQAYAYFSHLIIEE